MKDPILVILAAGLGSRYGGLKQIDTLGNNGESIIDFSIYDAIQAGFKKVVLIIRKEHRDIFEANLGSKIRKFIDVEYAFQDINDLPDGFKCPAERSKPWGTVQALLCTEPYVDGPFMIINADDFYGRESFKIMYDFLKNEVADNKYGMVGYQLNNTLTDNGSVTRAICENENGLLTKIVEIQKIVRKDGKPFSVEDDKFLNEGICSMNYWGFTPAVYPFFKQEFVNFLKEKITVEKSELVIPTSVANLIKTKATVKVMSSSEKWFGVTYPEDKASVMQQLAKYKDLDIYPFDLWK